MLINLGTEDQQIYQGDCLEILKWLPSNSVDLVLVDPPYATTQAKNDNKLNWDLIWKELHRICGGGYIIFAEGLFVVDLINSNRKEYKYKWIVNKVYKTNHLNAKKQPLRQIDEILVFGNVNYYPQKYRGAKNHSVGSLDKEIVNNNYGKFHIVESDESGWKYPSNLLTFDYQHPSTRKHHQQKPVELLEYLIKTYTKEGQIILDFTAGGGSLLQASLNTNRKSINIELEGKYIEMIKERLNV